MHEILHKWYSSYSQNTLVCLWLIHDIYFGGKYFSVSPLLTIRKFSWSHRVHKHIELRNAHHKLCIWIFFVINNKLYFTEWKVRQCYERGFENRFYCPQIRSQLIFLSLWNITAVGLDLALCLVFLDHIFTCRVLYEYKHVPSLACWMFLSPCLKRLILTKDLLY